MIEFRGVTKRFPDGTVAVDNLDLTVDDGKITVFVGRPAVARRHRCAWSTA